MIQLKDLVVGLILNPYVTDVRVVRLSFIGDLASEGPHQLIGSGKQYGGTSFFLGSLDALGRSDAGTAMRATEHKTSGANTIFPLRVSMLASH